MSSSMLMTLGTRALNAAYAQLLTTSNNIANANTPGYSRQEAKLVATEGQFTGSGYFGRGVTVQTVSRASNMFLQAQAATTRSAAAGDATRKDLLTQLEKVFGTGAAGLGAAATGMFNAYADLAAAPADLSARQSVMARLEDFASLARSNAESLSALQANVTQDVHNTVTNVNSLLAGVAKLNNRIADATAGGQTPNDLLDQRDALIGKISDAIELTTVAGQDGSVSLFTVSGQNLVLGANNNQLVAQQSSFDPERVGLAIKVGGSVAALNPSTIGGGTVSGLIAFQNDELVQAHSRLGQIVSSLSLAMNQQQSRGVDLAGQPGSPLFQINAPVALPARFNALSAGQFVSHTTLAVTDPAALQASEYRLGVDPANPGKYQITRLSDGQISANLANGDSVDGFSFNIDVPLAAGDSFLLKPVSASAAGLRAAMRNPRGVAAASPVTALVPAANNGTASVANLVVSAAPSAAYQALTVHFTSASGDWELLDSANAVQSTGTLASGVPISFNGIDLTLTGAPALGDRVVVTPTVHTAANNGNALTMESLANAHLVGGDTVTDAYAQTISAMGALSQGGAAAAATSTKVAAAANTALQGDVGVNLDEEAARLMQYQQSYQAAAKVLQTAQALLDTLIQMGSGR